MSSQVQAARVHQSLQVPRRRVFALSTVSGTARISQEVSILTEEQRNNLSLYVKQKAVGYDGITLVTFGLY